MINDDTSPGDHDTLRGWHRWALSALIGVFSLGLLAIWLVPGDAPGAQNRDPLDFPTLSPEAMVDKATYQEIDVALRDRVGAQVGVSAALGEVSVHLLGRSPTAGVLVGGDRQPFYTEDLTRPCRETGASMDAVKAGLVADYTAMDAAGKYVLFMVAPDKSSIRRSEVDAISPGLLRCSDFVRGQFETWESEAQLPLITLWNPVAELDQQPGGAYMRNDTHWNTAGSLAMSHALMERLVADGQAPAGLLNDLEDPVISDGIAFTGDLNMLMGVTDIDQRTTASFLRPDVITDAEMTVGPTGTDQFHFTSTSTTSALVPGKTLILGDSFLLKQIPSQLGNFFEDVTMADHQEYGQAGQFDRVIVERVQRFSGTEDWPPLTTTLW
ncbi:hypothetical protein [Cryobacterium sp. SO1]|uniref:alginate O-acetyltransferase AlgX-related protein n=1 Tax=Cryobacterium sp. SO1 TaxID=1897061 RepID=UPI001023CBB3|nr:hypothetical protein [Cryobacterium sp. SO1]RZI37392.1 hypothetical protein BJQ95_00222 [Cryobacterium sp. SO1]